MVSIEDYKGREQSYVKHVLLEQYLEALVHKTASAYPHIVYVDGFAGPWQSSTEQFDDTSFGIALKALRRAKASWKAANRDVKMTAILVEKNPASFKQLETLPPKFPDLAVVPLSGDFVTLIPTILKQIPADAFVFFLIDPKGWGIPLQALQPILARDKSEVIFNFMFEFINRAASIHDATVVAGLNELLPMGDWRDGLAKAQTSDERKAVLTGAFTQCLMAAGRYKHICETTILRPTKDRPLYSLFYGTRHDIGLEVFRDCQVKTLEAQAKARAITKVGRSEEKTGQAELFHSLHEMSGNEATAFLDAERKAARETVLALAPSRDAPIAYKDLWPQVLSRRVVRRPDVNKIAANLRKEGLLTFPGWESGKRVPQADYMVFRAARSVK
jgi:three-Cys-motif partner protein